MTVFDQAITDVMRQHRPGMAVTGWVVTVHGIDLEGDEVVLHQSAPGQPWVTSVGLIAAAHDFYRREQ